MAFRTSTGDFELDNYATLKPDMIFITWFIWFVAVFALNIIFMNFIIAVIYESYSKVTQKLVAESYKVKATMIVEREMHFVEKDFEDPKLFPRYLVLRRP